MLKDITGMVCLGGDPDPDKAVRDAFLKPGRLVVSALPGSGGCNSGLDTLEAAYMAAAGKSPCPGVEGWEGALRILEKEGVWMPLFLVYYDLRKRGRRARRGVRPNTLVYSHGSRRVEVLVLEEGNAVSVGSLLEWSRIASGDGYTPVVAIVDRNGGITYYEARALESLS